MEVDNLGLLCDYVLKGEVSKCKDGRTGAIFVMTYFMQKTA